MNIVTEKKHKLYAAVGALKILGKILCCYKWMHLRPITLAENLSYCVSDVTK